MSRMVLMCGLAGAGKSTHARRLEADGWLRFSIDRGAFELGHRSAPLPPQVATDVRARQRVQIGDALRSGSDVVVDYSFWSRSQRDDYRALGRACGAEVSVVYLDVPEAVLRRRLATRRAQHSDEMLVSDDLLTEYLDGFEPPGADEGDVTVMED